MIPAPEIPWLVWSNEHGKWWKPGGRGYTSTIGEAGRYTRAAADRIVADSNYAPHIKNEIAVLAPEAFALLHGAMPAGSCLVWSEQTATAINAGDDRVLLRGTPPRVPIRVLAEPNYQAGALALKLVYEGQPK